MFRLLSKQPFYLIPMNRKEKARLIRDELMRLYPDPPIPLEHKDVYTLLIAVLLSAQCTDKRVNLVTPRLFALADTPEKMARLSPEEVREIIRSCGLSEKKANAIVNLSKILIKDYGGRVPANFEELEKLPGVGHKTASVVMTQGFGLPAFPVDTHIYRLARKWGLSNGKSVGKVEKDLKMIFPQKAWGDIHLRIVLYGRDYCPARGCKAVCPICFMLGINASK